MDSCSAVDKELERVITKFTAFRGHSQLVLSDVTSHFEELQASLSEGKLFSLLYVANFLVFCIGKKSWRKL